MVLEVQRTYRLSDGRIAQVAITTYPASRFGPKEGLWLTPRTREEAWQSNMRVRSGNPR
ncbi:hypothetical protein QIH92_53920 (plasmid) [Bradyrhizobium japonicum USDA 123]|nr:hypothetical protein QIH92_53920 [Bradyrhizobium japonicum USDA 123]